MMAVMPVALAREEIPRPPAGVGICPIRTSEVRLIVHPRNVARFRVDPTLINRRRLVIVMLDDALFDDARRQRPLDHGVPLTVDWPIQIRREGWSRQAQ
jgi:hypothetical protein